MGFKVCEGFPFFHNRNDIWVGLLNGYIGGEVHGGGIFLATFLLQNLGYVGLEDFNKWVELRSFNRDGCDYVNHFVGR